MLWVFMVSDRYEYAAHPVSIRHHQFYLCPASANRFRSGCQRQSECCYESDMEIDQILSSAGIWLYCRIPIVRPARRKAPFNSELAGSFILTLSFICPFLYVASTLNSILNGLGKTALTFFYSILSLLVRLLFVFYAIPVYGIKGYLWGMLASQMVQTLLCTFSSLRVCKRNQSA